MWRFCLWVVGRLATPALGVVVLLGTPAMAPVALAQISPYAADNRDLHRHRHEAYRQQRRRHDDLSARDINPSRLGPAPAAFLYHCDAPAGFYPYIPTCRMPWRVVPSGAHR
jgi:hypothetical protein